LNLRDASTGSESAAVLQRTDFSLLAGEARFDEKIWKSIDGCSCSCSRS